MFFIAFTPNDVPAHALSAKAPTLMAALAELFKSLDALQCDEWFVTCILEATKEAVDNLDLGQPAKGAWSEMSCPEDAFSIDIFCADDAKIVKHDGRQLLAPHGAVGFVAEPHHEQWLYDEAEIADWDNVLRPLPVKEFEYTLQTIEDHNEPLRQAMFARGCEWKSGANYEHFTKDGEYEDYPIGYIRSHFTVGDHAPFRYSVQGPNGWLQRAFASAQEGRQWALETAAEVLRKE